MTVNGPNSNKSLYDFKALKGLLPSEQASLEQLIEHYAPARVLVFGPISPPTSKTHVVYHQCSDVIRNSPLERGLCVKFDLHAMPFASELVDLVVCCHTHEFCEDLDAFWAELERVLMPEGLLVCYGMGAALAAKARIERSNRFKFRSLSQLSVGLSAFDLKQVYVKRHAPSWAEKGPSRHLSYVVSQFYGGYEAVYVKRKHAFVGAQAAMNAHLALTS